MQGWVKLHSYTRNRGDIANYSSWWLQRDKQSGIALAADQPQRFEVLACREQGPGVVAQIKGITDPEQALALRGYRILVKAAELPELPQGEFYWRQLIGLVVSDTGNVKIGQIASILETGANDVLVVKNDDQPSVDVLIPYTDEVVKEIDIERGTMVVDWDPGYLFD